MLVLNTQYMWTCIQGHQGFFSLCVKQCTKVLENPKTLESWREKDTTLGLQGKNLKKHCSLHMHIIWYGPTSPCKEQLVTCTVKHSFHNNRRRKLNLEAATTELWLFAIEIGLKALYILLFCSSPWDQTLNTQKF